LLAASFMIDSGYIRAVTVHRARVHTVSSRATIVREQGWGDEVPASRRPRGQTFRAEGMVDKLSGERLFWT
jgi:hypothetical protein